MVDSLAAVLSFIKTALLLAPEIGAILTAALHAWGKENNVSLDHVTIDTHEDVDREIEALLALFPSKQDEVTTRAPDGSEVDPATVKSSWPME